MTQYTLTPKPMHTTTFCLQDSKIPQLRRSNPALNPNTIYSNNLPVFYSSRLPAYGTLIHSQPAGTSADLCCCCCCCRTQLVNESHDLDNHIAYCSSPGPIDVAVCHSKPSCNTLSRCIASTEPNCDTRTVNRNINITDPLMTDIVSESEKPLRSCDDPTSLYDLTPSPSRSQFYTIPGPQTHTDSGSPLSIESEWLSNVDVSLSCSSPSSASELSPAATHESHHPVSSLLHGSKPKFFRPSRSVKSSERCSNSLRLGTARLSPGTNSQSSRLHTTRHWEHLIHRGSPLSSHPSPARPVPRKHSLWLLQSEHDPSTISVLNRSTPNNDASLVPNEKTVDRNASPYGLTLPPGSHSKRLLVHSTGVSSCYPPVQPTELVHSAKRLHLLDFIVRLLDEPNEAAGLSRACCRTPDTNHTSTDACVEWVDEDAGVFAIKNPVRLAQLWGTYKNNRNMTFESLCRSLRLYYVSGKLERVRGQRNQYRLLDEPLH